LRIRRAGSSGAVVLSGRGIVPVPFIPLIAAVTRGALITCCPLLRRAVLLAIARLRIAILLTVARLRIAILLAVPLLAIAIGPRLSIVL